MKKVAGVGLVPFRISTEEHQAVAVEQREHFEALARRIESGQPLDQIDRQLAAGAVRAFAASIPLKPRRARGAPSRVDRGDMALRFALLRLGPARCSVPDALLDVSIAFDVSVQTVRTAVREHGEAAFDVLAALGLTMPGK